jgi:hypothetical protein
LAGDVSDLEQWRSVFGRTFGVFGMGKSWVHGNRGRCG